MKYLNEIYIIVRFMVTKLINRNASAKKKIQDEQDEENVENKANEYL